MTTENKYTPNWNNGLARKKLDTAIAWAAQYCIGKRGSLIPVELSSVALVKILGSKKAGLGDWLRSVLLKPASESYSTELHFCKKYYIQKAGFELLCSIQAELQQKNPKTPSTSNNSSTHTTTNSLCCNLDVEQVEHTPALDKLIKQHSAELEQLEFKMNDSSQRLWHSLQNMPRAMKTEFWSSRLMYNYDIEACAPSLIWQLAAKAGAPSSITDPIRMYVVTKTEMRAHISQLTGLDLDESKRLINSLFNGARLARNNHCSAYQMLGYSDYKITKLRDDPQVKQLRESIKLCWKAIEVQARKNDPASSISIRSSKQKWAVYFTHERRVLDAITDWLRMNDIKYFTEHDGFRTNKPLDVLDLQNHVYNSTGFTVCIKQD